MKFDYIRKQFAKQMSKGSFIANVLTLMTGTTIAQILPMLAAPLLTRMYSPDDFGVVALYSTIISVISVVATGRYELAIMLPKDDKDALNLVALSAAIAVGIACLTAVIVAFGDKYLLIVLKRPEISDWLYLIPLSVLLTGIYQALNYWVNRKKQYSRLAASRVSQSVSTVAVNLGMGVAGFGAGGLIGGTFIGQAFATGVLGWQVLREKNQYCKAICLKRIIENARIYQEFPKVNSLHAFLDILQTSGILFLISYFFGNTVLGFYSFTFRILKAPLTLIGSAISQVFLQQASEIYQKNGDLHPLLKKTMFRLGSFSFPVFLVLGLFSSNIFVVVFGDSWYEAGVYAQILAPWLFLNFVVSPISSSYLIVGKQKQALLFGIIDFISKLGCIIAAVYMANIKAGLIGMSLAGIIILLLEVYWILTITSKN